MGGSDFAALTVTICGGQTKLSNAPRDPQKTGKTRRKVEKSTH
jgi:hypothetical protein